LARQNFALKEKVEVVPLYIGDDVTDEDAFRALGDKGITVRVGELEGSRAKYYLKDTNEVFMLLKDIKRQTCPNYDIVSDGNTISRFDF